MPSATALRIGTVVLITPLGACLQPVVHPTRVEAVGSLAFGASIQTVLDSTPSDGRTISTVPAFSFGLTAGYRDTLRDGVASRVSLGAGTGGGYAGLYFELPRAWLGEWDVGAGGMAYLGAMKAVHPYVQLGFKATESIAPFVSLGSYLVTTPGDRIRPAVTFGASAEKFAGRHNPATGILWFSFLFGSTRANSTSCFIHCIPDEGYFPGTIFLIGLSSNLNIQWPTGGGPAHPSPLPTRR